MESSALPTLVESECAALAVATCMMISMLTLAEVTTKVTSEGDTPAACEILLRILSAAGEPGA